MTKKLFLENQYEREFDARILSINGTNVILDQTLFYPEGGGQPGDKGEINGIKVIDTKKEGESVIHILDKEPNFKVNESVHGKIDWNRRYRLMRSHSAAHLVSAVINKKTGANITGNQLEEDRIRIDFNLENFDKEVLSHAVQEANEIIKKNLEIKTYFLSRDEAMKIPSIFRLQKAFPEEIQNIRIVDIGGYDVQADGGTHVKNTEEIGKLEIVKFENKGKNNRRVYFRLAG